MDAQFWDNLYNSDQFLPWTDVSWQTLSFKKLSPFINADMRILDYGCGTGKTAEEFARQGNAVDVADISEVAVRNLRKLFDANERIKVYRVDNPHQLPATKEYDAIIAWAVFHHIEPEKWGDFVREFDARLARGGRIIVGGWAKHDVECREVEIRVSKVTKSNTWAIDGVKKIIIAKGLKIVYEETFVFVEAGYEKEREFVFYVCER